MNLTPLSPAPSPAVGPYTWDDFVALADDDRRELIDGYLIEVDVPTQLHEFVIIKVASRLDTWAEANGGTVLGSGYKVQITRKRGVMPDLHYYRRGNLPPDEQQGLVNGRPDLSIEVISPSSRTIDRVSKLNWYASKGVPEYWLIDPEAKTLERFLLKEGHYFVEPHGNDEAFTPETFPGLEIRLGVLWAGPVS